MAHPSASRTPTEHGDPALDTKAFRRSLGQYPTGVTVVSARHGEDLVGMAVNSFAAVSLTPPMVLWSIRHASLENGAWGAPVMVGGSGMKGVAIAAVP